MTGFGRGEHIDEKIFLSVEIKAVNHRYNEIVIRLPRVLNSFEDKIRKQIGKVVNRGRVDVFVNLLDKSSGNYQIIVDKEMVLAYNNAIAEVASIVGIENSMNDAQKISFLLRSNGVINTQETQGDVDIYLPYLQKTVDEALFNLIKMRTDEGQHIYDDLVSRVKTIGDKLSLIEDRSDLVVKEFQSKITDRVNELLKEYEQTVDQERVIHEVAFFADKANITEEIVRLKSHIVQFEATIKKSEAVGRKLDFIIQEFNREVNTMASKANDFTITQITIEMKSEIEKIREQIQNIE